MANLRQITLSGALCNMLASTALACAFHGYTPRPTLIDLLYNSEQIVLARSDPNNAARYLPVEALAGPLDLVELPQQPDKSTRTALAATPSAAMLFARDGAYGPWVQHDIIGPDLRAVVDTALSQQTQWQEANSKPRAQFFARQLAGATPAVRTLALLELDRVDYPTLRSLRIKGLTPRMADIQQGAEKLRPIRILLAGLSREARMAPVLSKGLHSAVTGNRRYIGAYSTAMIELGGAQAVQQLTQRYLATGTVALERRELMIEAFAIQGLYGSRKVKREIKRSLTALLHHNPDMAGPIARQFSRHNNWSLARAVAAAQIAAPPVSAKDAVPIAKYLAFARQ